MASDVSDSPRGVGYDFYHATCKYGEVLVVDYAIPDVVEEGATVTAYIAGDDSAPLTLPATMTETEGGTVLEVEIDTGTLAGPGPYRVEFMVEQTGTGEIYPEHGSLVLFVEATLVT